MDFHGAQYLCVAKEFYGGAGAGSHLDGVASGEQAGHTVLSEDILFSSLVLKVSQQLWKMV